MDEIALDRRGANDAGIPMPNEPASFEAFFEDENDRLFRLICVIVGNRQEAEDVCQEAFARVWERWERVAAMHNSTGYLHRTAMNVFRSRYRRTQVATRLGLRIADTEDAYAVAEDRHVVLQALRALAPRQRAAIVLTEILGYSAKETADMLGVREGTIRALKFQARSVLRSRREVSDV